MEGWRGEEKKQASQGAVTIIFTNAGHFVRMQHSSGEFLHHLSGTDLQGSLICEKGREASSGSQISS